MLQNTKYNIVFFGTPDFAVRILAELQKADLMPSLIVTAPDKPQGRKLIVTPPPVKVWALANNIPILQPEKLDAEFLYNIQHTTYDLFIVAAYGKILKKEVLDTPTHGTLNVHPSLLPKYRGASPIESAILSGDTETGVSIMLLDELMDHGPVLAQKKVPLARDTGATALEYELATLGGELLGTTIPSWIDGSIQAKPQEHDKAIVTKKIQKEDGLLAISGNAEENYRKIKAYEGWPRTYFIKDNKRIVISKARLADGILHIDRVIPEGKKEMAYEDFLRGK
ncbi:MAG: methionyl-tRNA formyltransferase [Candidatus Pacebacteria bacterium]|jgi:methionyl-tRNA formyltransferase|nr:methionyl-tRNA formyltransferase [Candidatus Paceibacterota bacterium]